MRKGLLCMVAFAMIFMIACSDEDAISEAPEIASIELIPSTCHPGDTVIMKVHYNPSQPGSNFYFTEYKCNLECFTATKKDASKGILLGYAEPTIKCKAPNKKGTYTITFQGTVSFTGNKAVTSKDSKGNKTIRDGILYGETNKVSAQLIVQELEL